MATNVYYNFPEISVSLDGIDSPSSSSIILSQIGQPTVNIQLNDVKYSAHSLYFYGSNNAPSHLVIKCFEDIYNLSSSFIYFAIPLKVGGNSVVDDIIDKKNNIIKLALNDNIQNGKQCYVDSNSPITIVAETAININSHPDKKFTTNLEGINIPSSIPKMNAVLRQQDLDWIMTCDLLTEDGPTTTESVDPGTTATTISFLMMAILIAGATHVVGPVIYQYGGMLQLAEKTSHYALNVFWGVALITLASLCVGQGVVTKNVVYYFIGIALALSYFSGTRSILNLSGVDKNQDTQWFVTDTSPVGVYSELFSKLYNLNIPVLVIFLFWISSFSGIIAGLPLKNDIAFSSGLGAFLLLSVGLLFVVSR